MNLKYRELIKGIVAVVVALPYLAFVVVQFTDILDLATERGRQLRTRERVE